MNYRHAYHAGNFADVHKHVTLVAILLHLRRKQAPFAVIDTHAGRGVYDLSGDEAVRSGEAGEGIARLIQYDARTPAIAGYLQIVRSVGSERYPGSPLIAAKLVRPQDRLAAAEQLPEEFQVLRRTMASAPKARVFPADGYTQLSRLVPPPERRGLVLIDPPYEALDEWQRIAQSFAQSYRRFTNGIYLIWYPLKSSVPAEALAGELKTAGATKLLSLSLDAGSALHAQPGRLSASGLLVVNPPFGFAGEMHAAQQELLPLLRRGSDARAAVTWLAGDP